MNSKVQSPKPCRLETLFLADQLERTFRGGAWHGPAVFEVLSTIDAATAAQVWIRDSHTIWEIAGHIGAWIRVATRRIAGEAIDDLSDEQNWPVPSVQDSNSWKSTLEGLEESHEDLHRAILGLRDDRLGEVVAGSDPSIKGLILGVLQHNTYHIGQIVLLAKKARGVS